MAAWNSSVIFPVHTALKSSTSYCLCAICACRRNRKLELRTRLFATNVYSMVLCCDNYRIYMDNGLKELDFLKFLNFLWSTLFFQCPQNYMYVPESRQYLILPWLDSLISVQNRACPLVRDNTKSHWTTKFYLYLSYGQAHFKPLNLRILVSGQVIFLGDKLIFPVACPMDKLGSFLILNTDLC